MNNQTWMFNFGEYGFPDWVSIDSIEMQVIWEGVMEMFENYTPEEIHHMSERIRLRLVAHAWCNFPCDEDWVSNALLVTAIQGWQGKEIAPHFVCEY